MILFPQPGSVEFITDFKISDKDDPFYDEIISLKTQSDNWILIETIHKILAYMSVDNKLVPISNIEDINISILTHYYVFLLNQKSISLRPLYLLILMNLILIFVQRKKMI